MTVGSKLITLRGPSAGGKSAVAARLRTVYGRGLAVVGRGTWCAARSSANATTPAR
jgi:cytidylate kinase